MSLKTVCDLAQSGLLDESTQLSRDGGPFQPIREASDVYPLIAAHLRGGAAPSYSGDLRVRGFLPTFVRLNQARAKGRLAVRDGVKRMEVHFKDGEPVMVESSSVKDRLGERLVDRGRLEREQLKIALTAMRNAREQLGQTLLRLKVLRPQDLLAELREQQIARLVELCGWRQGFYSFVEGETYTGEPVDLGDVLPRMVVEAMRAMTESAAHSRLQDCLHQIAAVEPTPLVERCIRQFNDIEKRMLAAINDEESVVGLITETAVKVERRAMLVVLNALLELGALRLRSRARR
ncbi:MAG: DUF4388 domain-containing protein [Deltaproteobacteria bacterium]|nr:DUF4388 domain-containing protein [Deltaproteobacteria bacterium]